MLLRRQCRQFRRLACRALGSADGARQVEVGVVENVVELCAELHLQALNGGAEFLVEREIGLVEGRCAARIAAGIAERAEHIAGAVLDRGKNEGGEVDVVDVARVGGTVVTSLGHLLAGDGVGTVLVSAAIGCRDLRRYCLRAVRAVGDIEGRAGLHGIDGADLPAPDYGVDKAVAVGKEAAAMPEGQLIDEAGDVGEGQVVVRLRVIGADVVAVLRRGCIAFERGAGVVQ